MGRGGGRLGLAVVLLAALLLAGCAQLEIGAGVDAQSNAQLSYQLVIDSEGFTIPQQRAVQAGLDTLLVYYRDTLGFTVHDASDMSSRKRFLVTLTKAEKGRDAGQAFDLLQLMLTDKNQTLMTRADLDWTDAGPQQGFYFEGAVDLGELLRHSNAAGLPAELSRELERALANSGGVFVLSLPATEVTEASHDYTLKDGVAVMEVPLSFAGATEIKLVTRMNSAAAGLAAGTAAETLERLGRLQTAAWCAAGTGLVLALAGLLGLARRRGRPEQPPKQ